MPKGTTRGIWHAAYCRPGQAMLAHVLLESGANWCGVPLHLMSTLTTFGNGIDSLQPWGGMGEHLEVVHLTYLEGLLCMGVNRNDGFTGRHTGLTFDWSDGFSRYPQEHKPLNLIERGDGQFMLLPNNHVQYLDRHFTKFSKGSEDFRHYRRGEEVYWLD
jgi:hypothetical protein